MDARLILGGQAPDVIGSMARGNALAAQHIDMQRQGDMQRLYREQGAGIAGGDEQAINALAGLDPMAAMGVQRDRLNMDIARRNDGRADQQLQMQQQQMGRQAEVQDREWQLRVQEHAMKVGAAQAQQEAQQIERAIAYGMALPDAASWNAAMAQEAPDLVGQFENRRAVAQRYMSVADILKGTQPQSSPGRVQADINAGILPQGTPLSGPMVNVNMGDGAPGIGKLSTDYGYVLDPQTREPVIDPQTGLPRAAPVPGSAAARELEAAEASRTGMQGMTARQLNPTIDDIATARDLADSGIGTTGMLSGLVKMAPGLGQGAVDMSATIDAIGSGISLENLNQMRQNSPTGGALGNVSDKQSGLLAEAFGSLRQSQSKDLFLYNLARIENTLNDIVHGTNGGPERHDMTALRRSLRRSESDQGQPVGQPAPQGGPQPGMIEDGYRFIGGDPADPSSWERAQ